MLSILFLNFMNIGILMENWSFNGVLMEKRWAMMANVGVWAAHVDGHLLRRFKPGRVSLIVLIRFYPIYNSNVLWSISFKSEIRIDPVKNR